MSDDRLLLALAVHRTFGLKSREKEQVFDSVPTPDEWCRLSIDDLAEHAGRPLAFKSWSATATFAAAERDLRICRALDIDIVGVWQEAYPPLLRESWDPPFLVFVRGTLPDPNLPAVAAVGTRKPDNDALAAAWRLGFDSAESGVPLISGLAAGIDSAAHRGTVEQAAGTWAVLGNGIDSVYPAVHRSLAARMLDLGGGLISEYPPRFPALRHHFPERNRIIAALSRWVVIVQAPERSGALITAEYALDCGRELVVHAAGNRPGERSAGTRSLALDGARVINGPADLSGVGAGASLETAMDAARSGRHPGVDALHGSGADQPEEDRRAVGASGGSKRIGHPSDVSTLLARRLDRELGLEEKEPVYGD